MEEQTSYENPNPYYVHRQDYRWVVSPSWCHSQQKKFHLFLMDRPVTERSFWLDKIARFLGLSIDAIGQIYLTVVLRDFQ